VTAEQELSRISPEKDTKLTVGVFDGVHLGHQYLIAQLKEHARQQNLLSGVVTFRQHPDAVLSPQTRLPFLTDIATRTRLLKKEGADFVVTLSFTRDLATLSARNFVSLLKKYLRMRALLVGPDFAWASAARVVLRPLKNWGGRWASRLSRCLPSSSMARWSAAPPSVKPSPRETWQRFRA